jgi:hypothetical protein
VSTITISATNSHGTTKQTLTFLVL